MTDHPVNGVLCTCPLCLPAKPMWTGVAPLTTFVTCTCGAFAASATIYPPLHGPDCALTSSNERYLWSRIRALEARIKELEPQR